jgi:hypothetical protein
MKIIAFLQAMFVSALVSAQQTPTSAAVNIPIFMNLGSNAPEPWFLQRLKVYNSSRAT